MRYEDFVIRIGPREGDAYHVRVEQSPAGEGKSMLELPFDMAEVGRMIGGLARTVRGAPAQKAVGETTVREAGEIEGLEPPPGPPEVGGELYSALFQGEVRERFIASLGQLDGINSMVATEDDRCGLRIRLKMDLDEPGLAEVASLPWEFLYPGPEKGFLNMSASTPVIRALDVGRPSTPYPFTPPMRVLVVIANPTGSAELDLEQERESIEGSWGQLPEVSVDFLDEATVRALQERLAAEEYHVLHFMGHGDFDRQTGRGVLLFDDGSGGVQTVGSDTLQTLLRDERSSLRLVFLNACKTAVSSADANIDPFAGVATSLTRVGIPALVAMQFPISDPAAIVFSATFYQKLVEGTPVDIAMVEARKAILGSDAMTMEWATPVLFMRSPDGVLFEPARTAPPPPPPDPEEVLDDIVDDAEQQAQEEAVEQTQDTSHEGGAAGGGGLEVADPPDEPVVDADQDENLKPVEPAAVGPTPSPTPRPSPRIYALAAGGAAAVLAAVFLVINLIGGPPTPTSLAIDPPPATVMMGELVEMVLSLRAEQGDDVDARFLPEYDIQWAAAPGGLAAVEGVFDSVQSRLEGIVTGLRPGDVTITASYGEDLSDSRSIEVLLSQDSVATAVIQSASANDAFLSGAPDADVKAMYDAITSRFDYAVENEALAGLNDRAAAIGELVTAYEAAQAAHLDDGLTLHQKRNAWAQFVATADSRRPTSPSIDAARERITEIDGAGGSAATLQRQPQLGVCQQGLCATTEEGDAVLELSNPFPPGHVRVAGRFATGGLVTWRLLRDGALLGEVTAAVPGGNERRLATTESTSLSPTGALDTPGRYEVWLYNHNPDRGGQPGDLIGRVSFCISSC